jgi:hypothetical protein
MPTTVSGCMSGRRNGTLSQIDRQRVAVRHLEAAGYRFERGAWHEPGAADVSAPAAVLEEVDAMHVRLVLRADALGGCTEEVWVVLVGGLQPTLPCVLAAFDRRGVEGRTTALGQPSAGRCGHA